MMKYILFITLVFTFIGCGLKHVETKFPNGKIKEVYTLNKNGEKEGKFQEYYEDGKIKEEAFFKNGKYSGIRTLFFQNGKPEIEENYTDGGLLNGAYKAYYDNGQVKVEKNYTQNVLTGPVKVYYESGKIKEEVMMSDNNENGPFTEYYEKGQIHWKGTYLNGDNEFGLLEEWDSLGTMIKRMKCDSMAVCRTFWRPGMPEVNYDTLKSVPTLKF